MEKNKKIMPNGNILRVTKYYLPGCLCIKRAAPFGTA
jgi:hypothetical protein